MKLRLLFIFLLGGHISFSQSTLDDEKFKIDSLVQMDTFGETDTFGINLLDGSYCSYVYYKQQGEIFKVSRRCFKDSISHYQTFIIQNNHPIFMEEFMKSTSLARSRLDSANGSYYFIQDQIFSSKSEWKGNSKFERKNPQKELLKEFKEVMDAIKQYAKRNGN
ncbi:MAG: hypothetical protein ACTHM7_06940 [Ginsengibacter sp.]